MPPIVDVACYEIKTMQIIVIYRSFIDSSRHNSFFNGSWMKLLITDVLSYKASVQRHSKPTWPGAIRAFFHPDYICIHTVQYAVCTADRPTVL